MRQQKRKKGSIVGNIRQQEEQSEVNGCFPFRLGVQNVVVLMKNAMGLIFKTVLPTEGGKHFFETYEKMW